MEKNTFLLLFVLGSGVLAVWVALRLKQLAPASFRSGAIHLTIAVGAGTLLGPGLQAMPGLPSSVSVLVALFAVALPVITYMLLVGLWLVQLAVAQAPPARR